MAAWGVTGSLLASCQPPPAIASVCPLHWCPSEEGTGKWTTFSQVLSLASFKVKELNRIIVTTPGHISPLTDVFYNLAYLEFAQLPRV